MMGRMIRFFESACPSDWAACLRRNLLIGAATTGLVLFGSLGGALSAAGTPTPTRPPTQTATRTPLRTPRRTPTRTLAPFVAALRKQLSWGGAGGGFSDPGMAQNTCGADLAIPKNLPAIIPVPRRADDFGSLCLVGFTFDQPVTLQFSSPDRKADVTGVLRRGEAIIPGSDYLLEQIQPAIGDLAAGTLALNHPGAPVAMVIVWMPLGLPEGRWQVEARSGGQSARTTIDTTWPKDAPRLAWRYPQASILGRPPEVNMYAVTGCNRARLGEKIALFGSGFTPNTAIPVGLYTAYMGSELQGQVSVSADRAGKFSLNFTADPLTPPGDYAIVAVVNPNTNEMPEAGPIACIKTLEWKPCPDAPLSRIRPNAGLRSNPAEPGANNVRSQPGLNGQIIGKFTVQDTIFNLGGPVCADKMVWWKVGNFNNLEGWVSEGQGEKIFLLPNN